jgi:Protein-tyrosine phosphatase
MQGPDFVWKQAHALLSAMDLSRQSLHQQFINIGHPAGSHLSMKSAEKKKNAARNRYTNILPFDHNGIKVRAGQTDNPRGQYINASMLKVCVRVHCVEHMPAMCGKQGTIWTAENPSIPVPRPPEPIWMDHRRYMQFPAVCSQGQLVVVRRVCGAHTAAQMMMMYRAGSRSCVGLQ